MILIYHGYEAYHSWVGDIKYLTKPNGDSTYLGEIIHQIIKNFEIGRTSCRERV